MPALAGMSASCSGTNNHRAFRSICPRCLLRVQVDVVTPTGKLLARRLSLCIEQGRSVLVTGPNGSGKSSLFRILGGLWPMTSGSIQRPEGADARIFYVPQKPYTTIGTLREQVLAHFAGNPHSHKRASHAMLMMPPTAL